MFGRPTKVEVEQAGDTREAKRAPTRDPDATRQVRADALNDPGIGRAMEILGAEIVDIRPVGMPG